MKEKLVCDFCGASFSGKGYLSRHIDSQHRKFYCDVCDGKIYSQKPNLLRHLRSHFERFICQYCGQEICRFEQFMKHIYTQHEPDNKKLILSVQSREAYSCRYCVRTFINAVQRNSHESVVHKGRSEAAFQCKECKLIFITKEDLRFHAFEHYAGSLHICAFDGCNRFFKSSKLLVDHRKIHAPPQYSCDVSSQAFCECQTILNSSSEFCFRNARKVSIKAQTSRDTKSVARDQNPSQINILQRKV